MVHKSSLSPRCRKSGIEGKELAWLYQDLLFKMESKKKIHRQWKQGQGYWEGYKDADRLCRDGIRKGQLKLDLARGEKKKKSFYKSINWKRKVQEGILSLVGNRSRLVITNK